MQDEIRRAGLYRDLWQSFAVLLPVSSVGVMGDERTYEYTLAIRAVAYRMFPGRFERRTSLTLGLLFASFSVVYGQLGIVGDTMSVWISWGYPFALMAVALVLVGLVRYDRARATGRLDWRPGLRRGFRGICLLLKTELLFIRCITYMT